MYKMYVMFRNLVMYSVLCCTGLFSACNNKESSKVEVLENDSVCYIKNNQVKLGIDMNAGGSLFYFAETSTGRNLLNHYDKGRFIQQSYYGIKDGSNWNGKPWRWNPIQGGGYQTEKSGIPIIIDKHLGPDYLYIKSHPIHWATGEHVKDVVYEEKITLHGSIAKIHFTFSYNGDIIHPKKSQELPAVFVDAALSHLCFYNGSNPWKDEPLESVVPGWPNEGRTTTEHWAAYVDDNNWGLGVYTPGSSKMTTYRYKGDGKQGPKGSACSYFAPLRDFSITPGLTLEYDVYLAIGNVNDIRSEFKNIFFRR